MTLEIWKDLSFSLITLKTIEAALKAGEILRKGFGTRFQISSKEGVHNLVTEYDHASEKFLISFLQSHFPSHTFLSEECGRLGTHTTEVEWIIDPLDGTVNFAHGIPIFSISIAARLNSDVISAVVYQPMTGELFAAEKGIGSFLNGKKIHVSSVDTLAKSFLATGFPYNISNNPHHCIDHFTDILRLGIPIRRLGSAAIDMAYVASGRFEGYFEVSLGPWDCAAGLLLVREAGGKVSEWDGKPFLIDTFKSVLVSNGKIHAELVHNLGSPL